MHNTWDRCKPDSTSTKQFSGETFHQCLGVSRGKCDSFQSNALKLNCKAFSVMWAPKLQHLNGRVTPHYSTYGVKDITNFRLELQNGPDAPLTTVAIHFDYAWPNSTWSNLYGVNVQCVHLGSNLLPKSRLSKHWAPDLVRVSPYIKLRSQGGQRGHQQWTWKVERWREQPNWVYPLGRSPYPMMETMH